MTGTLGIYKNTEELADRVADQLMEWMEQSAGERFDMALSGGSSPNLLFATLASKYSHSELWNKTHIWWVDERMVAPDDPESNYGTSNFFLFSKINIPKQNIHRICGENNPVQEAENYSRQIRQALGSYQGWPRFDLVFLGLGDDGHTASIFPNRLELFNSANVCEVAYHPVTSQPRVTLTGEVINRASKICFLVTGVNKSERLSEIWLGKEIGKRLPAFYIKPVNGELFWFTDTKAAQYLSDL
ncbi:MAG: 6-phosphogluconolactonase [Prolixibacteraceae bacterium]